MKYCAILNSLINHWNLEQINLHQNYMCPLIYAVKFKWITGNKSLQMVPEFKIFRTSRRLLPLRLLHPSTHARNPASFVAVASLAILAISTQSQLQMAKTWEGRRRLCTCRTYWKESPTPSGTMWITILGAKVCVHPHGKEPWFLAPQDGTLCHE